jgi:hypothetical protein
VDSATVVVMILVDMAATANVVVMTLVDMVDTVEIHIAVGTVVDMEEDTVMEAIKEASVVDIQMVDMVVVMVMDGNGR